MPFIQPELDLQYPHPTTTLLPPLTTVVPRTRVSRAVIQKFRSSGGLKVLSTCHHQHLSRLSLTSSQTPPSPPTFLAVWLSRAPAVSYQDAQNMVHGTCKILSLPMPLFLERLFPLSLHIWTWAHQKANETEREG